MQTQSKIRLAQPSDEAEVIQLLRLLHAENGMQRLDIECVREVLARAFDRKGGIIGVIGAPGHIRAMICLQLTNQWYTRDTHIEELFSWVHPDHRQSDYARLLIEFAKKQSDDISKRAGEKIPLFLGILTNTRMSAKVRLYRRFFGMPFGAIFLYNATWIKKEEVCTEDFWRVPDIAKRLFKREERRGQRDQRRVRV